MGVEVFGLLLRMVFDSLGWCFEVVSITRPEAGLFVQCDAVQMPWPEHEATLAIAQLSSYFSRRPANRRADLARHWP